MRCYLMLRLFKRIQSTSNTQSSLSVHKSALSYSRVLYVCVLIWSIYMSLFSGGLMKLLPDTLLQGFFITACRFVRIQRGEESLMCYCAEMNSFRGSIAEHILSLNVQKCKSSFYHVILAQGVSFLRMQLVGCFLFNTVKQRA